MEHGSIEHGLMVPGRPPTPSDGRAQHYKRPGNGLKQVTRTFANGSTLTFGVEDPIEQFSPGDAFYEQVLVILNCVADINAVRDRYHHPGLDIVESDGRHLGGILSAGNLAQGRSVSSAAVNPFDVVQGGYQEKPAIGRSASMQETVPLTGQNSNLLQVGNHMSRLSTVNVYQSNNRSNSPGLAHPGYSTDTRGPFRPVGSGLREVLPRKEASGKAAAPSESHGRAGRGRSHLRRPRSGHGYAQNSQNQRQQDVTQIGQLPVAQRLSRYVANSAIAETTIIVPQPDAPGQTFAFRINPPSPTNMGSITDIYSSHDDEFWKPLMMRNTNPEYRGLPIAVRDSRAEAAAPIHQSASMTADAFEKTTATRSIGYQRIDGDQTSRFFSENNERRSPDLQGARYVGYSMPGEALQQLNRTPTPTLPTGARRAGLNELFGAPLHFSQTQGDTNSRSSSPGGVGIGSRGIFGNLSAGRLAVAPPARPSSAGYQFH